jgi:uncharacterized alpha-E superfamily protein
MTSLSTAQQNYLVRAAAAELEAAHVKDPLARETWLRIAQGYRDLATTRAAGEGLLPP